MKIRTRTTGDRLPVSTQYGSQQQRAEAREALLERQIRATSEGNTGIQVESQREQLIRHQGLTIQATLSGPQWVRSTVGNRGQTGAYVTVTIGTIVITFRDPDTLNRYATAWTGAAAEALSVPAWVPQQTRMNRYREPGVVIAAARSDQTQHVRTDRGGLCILAGRVSWQILDRQAYASVTHMWTGTTTATDIWPH